MVKLNIDDGIPEFHYIFMEILAEILTYSHKYCEELSHKHA